MKHLREEPTGITFSGRQMPHLPEHAPERSLRAAETCRRAADDVNAQSPPSTGAGLGWGEGDNHLNFLNKSDSTRSPQSQGQREPAESSVGIAKDTD